MNPPLKLFQVAYPNEIVWNMLLDTSCNWLLIEKRNHQAMQVRFDVIELASGMLIAENISLWEHWWVSAVWIHQGKIVFSLYQPEATPIGKGVFVYDIVKKNILWQNLDLNFFGANRQKACVFLRNNLETMQARAYCLATGLPDETCFSQNENLSGFKAAVLYPTDSRFYKDLQTFIYQKTQHKTDLPIHYTETSKYICLGYSIEIEEKFAYFLLITDIAGNIHLKEQLNSYEGSHFVMYEPYLVVFQTQQIRIYSL